jgi:hypothetical protein
MKIFFVDETTASLLRALTSFNVRRRSYLKSRHLRCLRRAMSRESRFSKSRKLDRVLNNLNQMMFNVETSDIFAYLN